MGGREISAPPPSRATTTIDLLSVAPFILSATPSSRHGDSCTCHPSVPRSHRPNLSPTPSRHIVASYGLFWRHQVVSMGLTSVSFKTALSQSVPHPPTRLLQDTCCRHPPNTITRPATPLPWLVVPTMCSLKHLTMKPYSTQNRIIFCFSNSSFRL
jgi:hypothetical protein